MANATAPIKMVDIPREVKGVERKTKYARTVSNMPVNIKLVASVEYVFLSEMPIHSPVFLSLAVPHDALKVNIPFNNF